MSSPQLALPQASMFASDPAPSTALSEVLPPFYYQQKLEEEKKRNSQDGKIMVSEKEDEAERLGRSFSTEIPPSSFLTPFEQPNSAQSYEPDLHPFSVHPNLPVQMPHNQLAHNASSFLITEEPQNSYVQPGSAPLGGLVNNKVTGPGSNHLSSSKIKNGKVGPPYHGSKAEMGFRNRQEDRHAEQVDWYRPKFEHLSKQQIPQGLMKRLEGALQMEGGGMLVQKHRSMCIDDLTSQQQQQMFHFFAVFDGHGGESTSQFLQMNLARNLRDILKQKEGGDVSEDDDSMDECSLVLVNGVCEEKQQEKQQQHFRINGGFIPPVGQDIVVDSLKEAFLKTDQEFATSGYENQNLIGSTALVMVLSRTSIYIANCGDSRAVICRGGEAFPLSDDHKADRADEVERIENLGGQILYWNGVRVMGVLNMTRAIGDTQLKPYITADPEITVMRRQSEDQIIIMASDGLWDVFDNQEACNLALRCIYRARQKGATRRAATRVAATVLAKAAIDRGSRDNVTVIVVDLKSQTTEITEADVAAANKQVEQQSGVGECEADVGGDGSCKGCEHVSLGSAEDVTIPPSPFATPFSNTHQPIKPKFEKLATISYN